MPYKQGAEVRDCLDSLSEAARQEGHGSCDIRVAYPSFK
jgi:hypothetical protein